MAEREITKEDVVFYSEGMKIAAHLYRPADRQPGTPPGPAVVCLTGYTGRKNVATIDIPKHLARNGFIALAPDYVGYGESDGVRGRHRPLEQAQNTYDSVTYLETVDGVDPERIGMYGTSFGSANAIWTAAFDERIKVVVSAVGVQNGESWLKSVRTPGDWYEFRDMVRAEARHRVRTGETTMIFRYDIYPADTGAPQKAIMKADEHGAEDVTHVDVASVEACFRYRPEWVIDRIAPRPVLFFLAERDTIAPPEEIERAYAKCGEPKKLIRLPGARHNHVYEYANSEHFRTVARESAAWFSQHL